MSRLVAICCALLPVLTLAQTPEQAPPQQPSPAPAAPSSVEAKKVLDYYYHGKESGPLLVDLKACLKVDSASKDGPTRSECTELVQGPVKKGTSVTAWMLWLVPDGGKYDDVVIQFLYQGQVRSTLDLPLAASFRTRSWRAQTLSRAGPWQIRVMRGEKELGQLGVTAE